ncbi:hypothetical protein DSO57_1018512, partial [Entomophthora muscae]
MCSGPVPLPGLQASLGKLSLVDLLISSSKLLVSSVGTLEKLPTSGTGSFLANPCGVVEDSDLDRLALTLLAGFLFSSLLNWQATKYFTQSLTLASYLGFWVQKIDIPDRYDVAEIKFQVVTCETSNQSFFSEDKVISSTQKIIKKVQNLHMVFIQKMCRGGNVSQRSEKVDHISSKVRANVKIINLEVVSTSLDAPVNLVAFKTGGGAQTGETRDSGIFIKKFGLGGLSEG